MGTAGATGTNRGGDAANRAIASPLLEDNSIQGAQGILNNISGSSSLTLHEVHEASSVIQKAAHENANIIFGAVQDDNMKDSEDKDRKSTRLNSSHSQISYAVFCLKKKKEKAYLFCPSSIQV